MKEKRIPIFIIVMMILLLVLGAGAVVGVTILQRYIPSKEPADLDMVLGVSGEETALFLTESSRRMWVLRETGRSICR